ncbi:hypothetical protein V1477_003386 [Vespula maculifrons]|uniref:Uncharacterized protein n=1 Tax=Vespula maculifrons TaxID=7453 RepID=A0ABD2CX49_VESMC
MDENLHMDMPEGSIYALNKYSTTGGKVQLNMINYFKPYDIRVPHIEKQANSWRVHNAFSFSKNREKNHIALIDIDILQQHNNITIESLRYN